jgi:penicillin amidase
VYADTQGNIGWMAAALTPLRNWDGVLPVPGSGGFEWKGFMDYADLPQRVNPPNHVIATANHNILPEGYRGQIAYDWAAPYRYARIEEQLKSQQQFDLDDCKALQHDVLSLPGRELARHAATLSLADDKHQRLAQAMAQWDGTLQRDSKTGPLYAVWLHELLQALYRPHVPEEALDAAAGLDRVPVLLAALEKPQAHWFGDDPAAGRDKLLRESFIKAIQRVEDLLSPDASTWSWGSLHTANFIHPLASMGDEYARAFNLAPVGRPGDGFTPNATRVNDKFQQQNGATYRHVFDLADWDRGQATSAPGQSGQPGSPHYSDLLAPWSEGEYFPLLYSRAKVEEATQRRLMLKPAG